MTDDEALEGSIAKWERILDGSGAGSRGRVRQHKTCGTAGSRVFLSPDRETVLLRVFDTMTRDEAVTLAQEILVACGKVVPIRVGRRKPDTATILADWEAGLNIAALVQKHGVTRMTIRSRLKEAGIASEASPKVLANLANARAILRRKAAR